jgi:hypothetical protein
MEDHHDGFMFKYAVELLELQFGTGLFFLLSIYMYPICVRSQLIYRVSQEECARL